MLMPIPECSKAVQHARAKDNGAELVGITRWRFFANQNFVESLAGAPNSVEKPNCLDAVLTLLPPVSYDLSERFLEACANRSAAIVEAFVRHAERHKIDVNFNQYDTEHDYPLRMKWEAILYSADNYRYWIIEELLLSERLNVRATAANFNKMQAIHLAVTSLPCVLLLLDDRRTDVNAIADGSNALYYCIMAATKEPPKDKGNQTMLVLHILHELLKAGCDLTAGEQDCRAIDLMAQMPETGEARQLLQSYLDKRPITQRVAEEFSIDEEGRCVHHRFYADVYDKTPLGRLSMAFVVYKEKLVVDDARLLPNGKSRMTVLYTRNVNEEKFLPHGMFTSRVIHKSKMLKNMKPETVVADRTGYLPHCRSCSVENAVTIVQPCNHISLCQSCADEWRKENRSKCLLCRQRIRKYIRVRC